MDSKKSDKALADLYRMRVRDRTQYKSRRQKSLDAHPRPLSDLVKAFFQGDGEAVRKLEENRALMVWTSYVGESAARYSTPLRVRSHRLVVRVDDPLWMQQLSLLKHELLKKYQRAFPSLQLTEIFFTRQ
jgi:Dna[CI] antecedent, DciA